MTIALITGCFIPSVALATDEADGTAQDTQDTTTGGTSGEGQEQQDTTPEEGVDDTQEQVNPITGKSSSEALTWSFDSTTQTLTLSGTSVPDGFFGYSKNSKKSSDVDDAAAWYASYSEWAGNVKHVVINAGITSLGKYAFSDLSNLEGITFNTDLQTTSEGSFAYLTSLESVTLPVSVTTLGKKLFYNCKSLSTANLQNLTVTSLGDYMFYGCTSLTDVSFPNTITSLAAELFDGCTSLASIEIPSTVTQIGNYAFYKCTGLTEITIPDAVINLGNYVFYGCSSLNNVILPNNLNVTSTNLFRNCSSLTSVTLPTATTTVGQSMFDGCTALASVSLHEGITSISTTAFNGCTSLTSIAFPSTLQTIGSKAFYGCSGMRGDLTIPASVTVITSNAFNGCPFDGKLTIAGSTTKLCSMITGTGTGATVFSGSAFTSLENNSTEISSELLVANGVPRNLIEGLPMVGDVDTIHWALSKDGDACVLTLSGSGTISTSLWTSLNSSAAYDPSTISVVNIQEGITSIGDSAFICSTNNGSNPYWKALTSIYIPASVTTIGTSAFAGSSTGPTTFNSSNLTNVTIANGSNLAEIGSKAFMCCQYLKGLDLSDTKIVSLGSSTYSNGTGAFDYSGIEYAYLPDNLKTLDCNSFSMCSKLTTITGTRNVEKIGKYAFRGCTSLTTLNLSSQLLVFDEQGSSSPEYTACTIDYCGSIDSLYAALGDEYYTTDDGHWFNIIYTVSAHGHKLSTYDASLTVEQETEVGTCTDCGAKIYAKATQDATSPETYTVEVYELASDGTTHKTTVLGDYLNITIPVSSSAGTEFTVAYFNSLGNTGEDASFSNELATKATASSSKTVSVKIGKYESTVDPAVKCTITGPTSTSTGDDTPGGTTGGDTTDTNTGGSTSDDSTTTENPDGSTTTTVTADDGTKTATTEYTDGSTNVTVTNPDGTSTSTTTSTEGIVVTEGKNAEGTTTSTAVEVPASVTDAAKGAVTLPIAAVKAGSDTAVSVKAEVGASVVVPVAKATGQQTVSDATVLVAVDADGNEIIIPKSIATENGVAMVLPEGTVTVKVKEVTADLPDIQGDEWYANGVADFVVSRGLIKGVEMEDGTYEFQGDTKLSRGMFATVLHRLESEPTVASTSGFTDVEADTWYTDSVAWAQENDIIQGYEGTGSYGPNDDITREQMATIMMRYANMLGLDTSARADLSAYSDAGDLTYGKEAMQWAVSVGLIHGYGGTDQLGSSNGATRAEASVVIERLVGLFFK